MNSQVSQIFVRLKNSHLMVGDWLVFLLTPSLAFLIHLDPNLTADRGMHSLTIATLLFLTIKSTGLLLSGGYRHCWRYASVSELLQLSGTMLLMLLFQTAAFETLNQWHPVWFVGLPSSLPLMDGLLSWLFVGSLRFGMRAADQAQRPNQKHPEGVDKKSHRTLIVGAGSAGVALVHEMQRNPRMGLQPIAFIDDNLDKINLRIRGISVVGDRHFIPEAVRQFKIQRIIIAMPAAPSHAVREIAQICQSTGIQTRTLPTIREILEEQARPDAIRDIRIEDLLRRDPIQTDIQKVRSFLRGKRVLVTGAGGSIGSELCRQILRSHPHTILLLGKGENSIFYIQQELEKTIAKLQQEGSFPGHVPNLEVCIADVRNRDRLAHYFNQFQPEVIFHAAAHKHVPLMELNAPEAITSNILGTKNVLELAIHHQVKHFILISTDKAVNPTNVMGATKRMAEMLVLQAAKRTGYSYVAVRFGNVLGSRGSVIPTFQKQIAAGGPVTVTHPDMCRYFMTIPEAVQLTLQAAVLGRSGEVMMLNMGEPVRIVDLAQDLIRLSGYEVGKEISIAFSGLRPGEKLFEELFIPGERYEPTEHEQIIVVRNASSNVPDTLLTTVMHLSQAALKNDTSSIRQWLKTIVTGYRPDPYSTTEVLSQKPTVHKPALLSQRQLTIDLPTPRRLANGLPIQ
ncbi:MAG: nucleoside-diphosphate sugar epimerase/dehydratase [Synechococcales bacterium]|nr:nucleoside-diphosphate sugar epimerase/dehydratase [Synechococcales bacterium]